MFCKSCGTQIPDGTNVCPSCGAPAAPTPAQNAAPTYQSAPAYQAAPAYQNPTNAGAPNVKSTAATVALACGISSIVLAVLGGIMFGAIAALIAVVVGIVAVVAGTNAKKETNGVKGNGGFVCGLLGLIFGLVFAAGCGICGCSDPTGYTCYGCVGGSCKATQDAKDIYNMLDDYDW